MKRRQSALRQAFLATLPVLAGYLVLGAGFGMILESRGFHILWAPAMSLLIYAGSMQFVAVNLLTGGASLLTAALTTLMVNARHVFYGISMIERYRDAGRRKPYLIFALTDETYSLLCGEAQGLDKKERQRYNFYVSLLNQCYWVLGSVLGALLGMVLPISTQGIDFALTALFVTVFVEQWKSSRDHLPALIGVFCSLASLLLFGAEHFLIPAMLAITIALSLLGWRRGELRRG